MVKVDDLSLRFGALQVLDRVSFALQPGDFATLVGPSGCGKTILLRTLAGLQEPTSGAFALQSPLVAYAFQKSPLFPWLTLEENVRICMSADGRSEQDRDKQIVEYFQAAKLEAFRGELPSHISVGMRQKVNVIRAFCSGWPLILMDEPFASLDFPARRELQLLTLELWIREKKTILFVTHDIDEALLLSQKVLVLSKRPGHVLREITLGMPFPRDPERSRASAEYHAAYDQVAALLLESRV